MNIPLIKKFKEEFDYHINGGMIYHCYDNNFLWCSSGYGIWNNDGRNNKITHVIKNDKYVEYRKALAEGKTIQYRNISHPFFKKWQDLGNLSFNPNFEYRIKPEQTIKVGVWVENITCTSHRIIKQVVNAPEGYDTVTVGNVDVGINVMLINDLELWEPLPNEWCWVFNNKAHIPVLRKFISVNNTEAYPYKVESEHSKGTVLSYRYIEPFIGELPNFAEDFE